MIRKYLLFGLLVVVWLWGCEKEGIELPEPVEIEYHEHGEVDTVFFNGLDMINFVFFTRRFGYDSLKVGGDYEQEAMEAFDYIFTTEPFKTYKQYFNAYIIYHDTDLSWYYYPNKSYEYFLDSVNVHCWLYSFNGFRGTGDYETKWASAPFGKPKTFLHEVGHAFANLGDEYVDEELSQIFGLDCFIEKNYHNIDTTADLSLIKWKHLIDAGYDLGAFEGAYYHDKEYYMPTENSVMQVSDYKFFNAPSREAIVKEIFKIVGREYDFNEFLANDRKN